MLTFKSKSEIVNKLRDEISSKPNQAVKALIKLYNLQREDEKASAKSSHNNGVGFNLKDAMILTAFAKFYMENNFLTDNQMRDLYLRIAKYAKQLVDQAISNGLYVKTKSGWIVNN